MPWNYIIAFPPFRQGQIKQTELILQKLLTFVTGHSQRSTAMVFKSRAKGTRAAVSQEPSVPGSVASPFRGPRTGVAEQTTGIFPKVIHNHYHE